MTPKPTGPVELVKFFVCVTSRSQLNVCHKRFVTALPIEAFSDNASLTNGPTMDYDSPIGNVGSSNGHLSRRGDADADSSGRATGAVSLPEALITEQSEQQRLKNIEDERVIEVESTRQYEDDTDWEAEHADGTFTEAAHAPQLSERCNVDSSDYSGWQDQFLTLKSRLSHLCNNELMSDVIFRVGRHPGQQRFHAHKFVLAIGSSVFHVMFFGTMAEHQRYNRVTARTSLRNPSRVVPANSNNCRPASFNSGGAGTGVDEVVIDDVEPAAFETLLRMLYTDSAEITHHFVMSSLYLAKKYAVPALERLCIEFLQTNLSPDNAFLLLTQARLFDEQQLVDKCLDSIDQRTVECLDTEYFMDVNLDTLCIVLERDSLQVRESKLFSSVLHWAQHQCMRQQLPVTAENQRRMLGRALHMLRFPIMTLEEFANGPAQSGILTDAELVQLFLHFTINPKPDVPFLDVPRNCYTGKEHVVSRFQRTDRRWGYTTSPDSIRMSVSRPVFVVGFGLFGSAGNASDYAVTMEILEISSQRKLAEHKTNFTSDGSQVPHRVLFPKPVGLQADHQYLLSVLMKGSDSYYGTGGQATITQDCGKEGVLKINFSYSHGSNTNGTSVEDGQIPEIIYYLCGPNSFSASGMDNNLRSKQALVGGKSNNVSNASSSGILQSASGQKAINSSGNSYIGRSGGNLFASASVREGWASNARGLHSLPNASPVEDVGGGLLF